MGFIDSPLIGFESASAPCVICGQGTDLYFSDGEDYQGAWWGPRCDASVVGAPGSVRVPQAYVCSRSCLHHYLDRCCEHAMEQTTVAE